MCRGLLQHAAGDFAAAVKDTNDRHNIGGSVMPVDDNIGQNEADSHVPPKGGTGRAAVGMIG